MPIKNKIFHMKTFKSLFLKWNNEKLTSNEEFLFNRVLFLCEWDDLVRWEFEILGENRMKKKKSGGWMSYFSRSSVADKEEQESFLNLTESEKPAWKMTCKCVFDRIDFKLATYNLEKKLIQSQTVQLSQCSLGAVLCEESTAITTSIDSLKFSYQDLESQHPILSINRSSENPAIVFNSVLYNEIKTPNEIYYESQSAEYTINLQSISHLMNFISIKDLSAKNKTEIFDKLKNIQDKAMSQITDIFYYEKTYKISLKMPIIQITLPVPSGNFVVRFHDLHILDGNVAEVPNYSSIETGCALEVLHNDYPLVPAFKINFIISTLAKKFLKLKWECRKSDFDELCDILVKGSIQKIAVNFTFSIINDLKYIQNNTKIQESRESLLLDKKSIIKNMDLMQSIVLNNGYTKQKCVAVLKNDAIYYFADSKGNYAFDYVIFSGGVVSFSEDTIKMVTKSRVMQMSYTKLEVANRWLEKLQENSGPPQQIIKEKSFEKKVFYFDFSIEHSAIQLISAENVQEYSLEFKKQLFVFESNPFTQLVVIQSSGIIVKDKNNINLLAFGGNDTSENITIKHISPDSKDFKDVNLVIRASLNGGRVFCHQSALKQLITSVSNLGNYDKGENNQKELLFKISCDYEIANFSIIFSKNSIDQGKFALDVFSGQVFYDGIHSFIKAELSNLSVNWLEKDSQLFAPLIKSNPQKSIALDVETCSDYLKTQLTLPFVNIVIIPGVLVRLYKYFNYLIPNVRPKKTAIDAHKGAFEVDAGVKVEELKITAKVLCSSEQELNIKIQEIDFSMDNSGVKVEVNEIRALMDFEIFTGNFIRARLGKSVVEIRIGEFLVKTCPNDCNFLLQLMNLPKISAKPDRKFEEKVQEVKEEQNELGWKAAEELVEGLNSEKATKIEEKYAVSNDGEWKMDLECKGINFVIENLEKSIGFALTELKVAQVQDKEKGLIQISIESAKLLYGTVVIMDLMYSQLEPEYIIVICSKSINVQEMIIGEIKVNYDSNLISFLQDFSKAIIFPTSQAVISDKPEQNSIKYKISLKKITLFIDFQNIITSISQEIDIEYSPTPYSVKLQMNNFSIVKQTEFMTIPDLQLTMTSSPITSTKLKFSTISINFNIEDLIYFKNFYFSSLPKRTNQPPPLNSTSSPHPTHYFLDFDSIKLNFLSSKKATLFEMLISFQEFKGLSDSSLKISADFEVSVQYQNPLLQLFESFIEPIPFRLSLSIGSSMKFSLEAVPNSVLSLNLTDSTIQHLYNLYYSGLEGVHPFTILNTTGCKIIIDSTDGNSILIEDQEFKEFFPPTENTKLSCTVILSEGHSETLTRIPLFSQEVQSHYISNHICITTQVGIVNQYMQLKISSPIQVKNHTELELQVAFLTTAAEGGIQLAKMCGPHTVISVPLSCVKGFFALIPRGTERKECKILEIEALRKKDWICKSGEYYFLMQLENSTMHIRSTMSIANYLPIDLTISIRNEKSVIEPMKKIDYFFAVDKSIKIAILVKGFFQVNDYVVFTKSPVKKITLKNELLSVEVGCSVSIEHGYALTIYPFVLLVNKTLLPLDFYVTYKGSFICFSENYKNNRVMCGDIETIYARASNKSSTPLDLKHTLTKFFEIPSETGAFCMLYKIISAKVPNSKAITKIVTFHSRILLNNLMQQEIKVNQCESGEEDFSAIKAGQITYFNWKDPRANLHLTVKVEGLSLDWSGPFEIEKPNTFYVNTDNSIRFSDNPGTVKQFVKVVVKDDSGTMNVFFYNSVESDIQILNQSTHSLLVYQEKFSFPSFIPPQSTEYFAWFSQVHKQSLFIQTDYEKDRYKFQVNLERIGVSEEFRLGESGKTLHVFLKKEANTTILVINEFGFSKPEASIPNLSLSIKLPRIMLSIIQQDIYFKQEVLLITLTDYTNTISQYSDHISWDVSFKDMQIDSQIYEYVVCPVFMISEGENFFRFKGNIIISEKWICLEDIEIAPKSFIMNVDSNSLQSIMKFYKRFISETSYNLSHYLSHTNQEKEVTTAAYVYLSKLEIPAFTTTFSYKNLPGNVKDHFKSYFMNFENMTICFEKLSYKSLYGSPFSLSFLISGFYRKMVMENLDSILKQHGMIGGAMVIGLKISNKLSSVNKKSKKDGADVKDVNFYNKRMKDFKSKTNMRFTKYASRNSLMVNAPKEETSTIQSFIQMVNNPISGIIGLFSKKKESPDKDEVFVSRQRPTRVFYGKLRIIKPFQEFDSIAAGLFRERKAKYIHYAFYGQVTGIEAQSKQNMMFVGFDKLLALINLDETKVMWKVKPVFMEPLLRDNGMLVFAGVDKRNKKFKIRMRFIEDTAMQEVEILVREILEDISN